MGSGFDVTYKPNRKNALVYDKLYKEYCKLGEFVEKNTKQ